MSPSCWMRWVNCVFTETVEMDRAAQRATGLLTPRLRLTPVGPADVNDLIVLYRDPLVAFWTGPWNPATAQTWAYGHGNPLEYGGCGQVTRPGLRSMITAATGLAPIQLRHLLRLRHHPIIGPEVGEPAATRRPSRQVACAIPAQYRARATPLTVRPDSRSGARQHHRRHHRHSQARQKTRTNRAGWQRPCPSLSSAGPRRPRMLRRARASPSARRGEVGPCPPLFVIHPPELDPDRPRTAEAR
jgi:hypothetical protein